MENPQAGQLARYGNAATLIPPPICYGYYVRTDKRNSPKPGKQPPSRGHKQGIVGYSKKGALLEEAITLVNAGKYGRCSSVLKELLTLDPQNLEARRLFATLHLRLGSLVTARQAFESLANEAIERQDYWLAESLLKEYLAAGPRCVPFLELLAHVYQEKGDDTAAVVELGKAVEILLEDPDPDNPQKAAQLYAKIRELGSASLVAFRLAPSFDSQTGEFRSDRSADAVHQTHDGPQPPVEAWHPVELTLSKPSEAAPADRPVSLDSSLATEPCETPMPDSSIAEGATGQGTDHTSGILLESSMRKAIDPAPALEAMAEREPQASPFPIQPATEESVNPEIQTEAVITEATDTPVPTDASALETPADMPLDTLTGVGTGIDSKPVALPMPWEEVADATLEIVETEQVAPDPLLDTVPVSSAETELLPSSAPQQEVAGPDVEVPTAEEEIVPGSESTFAAEVTDASVLSHPESSAITEQPQPEPQTFSWNAIFDSAWKIAVGKADVDSHRIEEEAAESSSSGPEGECDAAASRIVEPEQDEPSAFKYANPMEPAEPVVSTGSSAVEPDQSIASSSSQAMAPWEPAASAGWDTGEMVGQLHRQSAAPPAPSVVPGLSQEPVSDELQAHQSADPDLQLPSREEGVEPGSDTRPEWARASEAIVLGRPEASSPVIDVPEDNAPSVVQEPSAVPAASTTDGIWGTGRHGQQGVTERPLRSWKLRSQLRTRVARLRQYGRYVLSSCFSTTRSFIVLCVSLFMFGALGVGGVIGVVALTWMVMEEPPGSRPEGLMSGPQRLITDYTKNGYVLLLGFDAPSEQDPIRAGYERKAGEQDVAAAQVCMRGNDSAPGAGRGSASANVVNGWFKGREPLGRIQGQAATVRSLAVQESTALSRYRTWLTLPFEDWGYGTILSPNCPQILLAHRLFLLDGFNQDMSVGLSRLERDLETWRAALGRSHTLMTKMLAVAAIQDDVAMASGLLIRTDTDAATVSRLAKIVRPLEQQELSVRWPMWSHYVWATGTVAEELKKIRTEEHPIYVSMAATMPLPVHRRANAYAEYYQAADQAVAEGRYMSLPKVSAFVRSFPSFFTYWVNPLEHILGIEPLPSWDPYVARMLETDALLRLASLQAWVRRGPPDGDYLARLAKAGQIYYDPFTGLPMLVNRQKRLLYSVGADGQDQDGDRELDVVVPLPPSMADGRLPSR